MSIHALFYFKNHQLKKLNYENIRKNAGSKRRKIPIIYFTKFSYSYTVKNTNYKCNAKSYFSVLFLCINTIGFSQIPNLPTIQSPVPTTFQNYSNNNLLTTSKSNVPAVPQNYINGSLSKQEEQNRRMVLEDFKRAEAEEKERNRQQAELNKDAEEMKFREWVTNGRNMSYDLPTLSGKAGTQSYYDAFDKLFRNGCRKLFFDRCQFYC